MGGSGAAGFRRIRARWLAVFAVILACGVGGQENRANAEISLSMVWCDANGNALSFQEDGKLDLGTEISTFQIRLYATMAGKGDDFWQSRDTVFNANEGSSRWNTYFTFSSTDGGSSLLNKGVLTLEWIDSGISDSFRTFYEYSNGTFDSVYTESVTDGVWTGSVLKTNENGPALSGSFQFGTIEVSYDVTRLATLTAEEQQSLASGVTFTLGLGGDSRIASERGLDWGVDTWLDWWVSAGSGGLYFVESNDPSTSNTVTITPEPGTWAMMTGMALVG
ncbi:MAG: hypothetical protein Q4C47_03470, partial [Planctomycetia bacterium]|nr:hypothetical protein [Planctomycetia bacterium]